MTKRIPGAVRGRPRKNPVIKIPGQPAPEVPVNPPDPAEEVVPGMAQEAAPLDFFGNLIARVESKPGAEQEEEKPRGRSSHHSTKEDFSTLISSVLALSLAALNIPSEIKPSSTEIDSFAYYSSRIIIRHLPAAGKLNADMLDIIGLLSTAAGYYMRVAPLLPKYTKRDDDNHKPGPTNPAPENGPEGGAVSDLSQVDPVIDQWLNRAASNYNANPNSYNPNL